MAWRGFTLVRKLTKTEFFRSSNTTWSQYRLNPYIQQVRCFRREAKRSDNKKSSIQPETKAPPSENRTTVPPPPKPRRPSMLKPVLFTLGFTGCSFAAAAILQYETLRSKVNTGKEEESEEHLRGSHDISYWHNWWNQLTDFQKQLILLMSVVDDFWSSLTEGQRTVTGIVSLLGKEQFLAFYLSAGVISNMVSYMCRTATKRFHPSLGASGAIMAVLAAVCTKVPEAKLGLIFLPMVTISAGNVLKALIAVDTTGLILGWRFFDHAAHLGGALFGVWYVTDGHRLIWKRREPFVKLWNNVRSKASDGPKPGADPGNKGGGGEQ